MLFSHLLLKVGEIKILWSVGKTAHQTASLATKNGNKYTE